MPLPLMAIAAGAGLLGKLMGKGGEGAAKERTNQNDFQQQQNQLANQQFNTQQNAATNLAGLDEKATMDRANLGVSAPSARMKQALLGSLLQNYQSRNIEAPAGIRMGKVSGGLDLSTIADAVKAGGGELSRQGLEALYSKSDVPMAANYSQSAKVAAPSLGGYQGAGKMESILSGGGLLGSLLGSIAELSKGNGASTPGAR